MTTVLPNSYWYMYDFTLELYLFKYHFYFILFLFLLREINQQVHPPDIRTVHPILSWFSRECEDFILLELVFVVYINYNFGVVFARLMYNHLYINTIIVMRHPEDCHKK